jgi:hypothetical protein
MFCRFNRSYILQAKELEKLTGAYVAIYTARQVAYFQIPIIVGLILGNVLAGPKASKTRITAYFYRRIFETRTQSSPSASRER